MDIRYPVLQAIGIEGKDYVEILNEVGSPNETRAILEKMFRAGLTSSKPQAHTNIELTDKGVCLLSQLQRDCEEESERKANEDIEALRERAEARDQRDQNVRYKIVIAVLSAVAGSAATLLCEHFDQAIQFVVSLFH